MTTETQPLAWESGHWYAKDGSPCYEVPRAKGDGLRDTTLADARKLDLVPSVTAILNVAAKPGLDAWKAKQLLESALTLPQLFGETLDDYAIRVIEDSKAQSQKARDKGSELHAEIESFIQYKNSFGMKFEQHIQNTHRALLQLGIDICGDNSKAEHSFASPLLYGGKVDFHNDEPLIIDFKTKSEIDDKKQLVWPEHVQQLAAYGFGMNKKMKTPLIYSEDKFRALNVFVGTADKQVRIIEHSWDDLVDAFEQFRCLLSYWQMTKKFGPYAKEK